MVLAGATLFPSSSYLHILLPSSSQHFFLNDRLNVADLRASKSTRIGAGVLGWQAYQGISPDPSPTHDEPLGLP
jgi:hypothetical protein